MSRFRYDSDYSLLRRMDTRGDLGGGYSSTPVYLPSGDYALSNSLLIM